MTTVFSCPLCGAGLIREARRYRCPADHSFDVAREGYVDLLPVNRRHSRSPGDDREMVDARRRFLSGGWYGPLREALCRLAGASEAERPVLLDAGCGEGYYTQALSALVTERGGAAAGVDLSKTAAKRAARLCRDAEIAVASVYRLPLADGAADILVNCFSPLAAEEFSRVLRPGGLFLYAVPGPRHLWELKEILYDDPYENPEKTEEYPGFRLLGAEPVETRFTLTAPEDIAALYHMTPYTWKTPREGAARLASVEELAVTAQFRVFIYRKT
ncbi:MAG: methyltransferase domain-containing protein [Oscillospiraceae bacterium]|nr:methyltransferase domain-containing protein [Oscillospiraceae bacterium]